MRNAIWVSSGDQERAAVAAVGVSRVSPLSSGVCGGRYFPVVQETDDAMQIRELEQAVAAMREALDLKEQEAFERSQRAVADAAAECAELKATVRALRERLESELREHTAAMQETERLYRGELQELQDTVQALRAQLEQSRG
jgi:hypothetical protein